jgi:NAD+ diphosphatase
LPQPEAFFAGPGLNRADPLRADPQAIAALSRRPDARQLRWHSGLPALDEAGGLQWDPVTTPDLFLGLDGDTPCFSPIAEAGHDLRAQFGVLSLLDAGEAPVFAAALSLSNWHRRHTFCSTCGQPSKPVRGGWSRRCGGCNAEHFPRTDPVVIMLATHRNKVLLGRQPQYPPGRYSALAGFVEPGETIEAAVARELGEEAGIAVTDVTYVMSQPWPFPSSLMIACTAVATGDQLVVDYHELEDARWFSAMEVAAALAETPGAPFIAPPRYAVARTLIEHWLQA